MTGSAFGELGLHPILCQTVARSGYETPTPIQRATIPVIVAGRDVLGCAQTGTGKTAAFALPILDRLRSENRSRRPGEIRVLVLAPTRELASQISDSFNRYGAGTGLRAAAVFGGVGIAAQIQKLRQGLDVLVACPGRLLDLIRHRAVTLSGVDCLVLDEADRMLDMGFIADVRRFAAMTRRDRQTLLFSATMPEEIRKLASELLRDPARIALEPISSSHEAITQRVYLVPRSEKTGLLVTLLQDPGMARTLVFTRTKHGADRVVKKLGYAGIPAAAIHGNKSQNARERALRQFKDGSIGVVVATDIAARGIDIKELSHVVNFDLPVEPEAYVHRVGRTGRAGASGVAFSFCSGEEEPLLVAIEKLLRGRIERIGGTSNRPGGRPANRPAGGPTVATAAPPPPSRPGSRRRNRATSAPRYRY